MGEKGGRIGVIGKRRGKGRERGEREGRDGIEREGKVNKKPPYIGMIVREERERGEREREVSKTEGKQEKNENINKTP